MATRVALAYSALEMLQVEEAALAIAALRSETPLSRYFQFRIYKEIVGLLEKRDELPLNFAADFDLNAWIGGRSPPHFIREKLLALLYQMKESAATTLDELCRFYCEYATELKKSCKFGNLIVTISGLSGFAAFHAALLAVASSLGIAAPLVLVILAFLIQEGILDQICDCA